MTTKRRINRAAPFRDKVVAFVRDNPNCTSQDLSAAFALEPQAAAAALYHTFDKGFTCRVRQGRSFHYWLKDDAPRAKDAVEAGVVDVDVLKAKLAELEARLAEAEEKHPDLRQIDYEAYRPALVAFYAASDCFDPAYPMDDADRDNINGLIAAMPFMPKVVA